MSAPNLLKLSTITPNSAQVNLTTSALSLASNAASSSTTLKIDSLYVSNISTTTAYSVILNYYSAAALGGTSYPIAYEVTVLPNTTVVLIDKNSYVLLLENTSLGALASASSVLVANCNWLALS